MQVKVAENPFGEHARSARSMPAAKVAYINLQLCSHLEGRELERRIIVTKASQKPMTVLSSMSVLTDFRAAPSVGLQDAIGRGAQVASSNLEFQSSAMMRFDILHSFLAALAVARQKELSDKLAWGRRATWIQNKKRSRLETVRDLECVLDPDPLSPAELVHLIVFQDMTYVRPECYVYSAQSYLLHYSAVLKQMRATPDFPSVKRFLENQPTAATLAVIWAFLGVQGIVFLEVVTHLPLESIARIRAKDMLEVFWSLSHAEVVSLKNKLHSMWLSSDLPHQDYWVKIHDLYPGLSLALSEAFTQQACSGRFREFSRFPEDAFTLPHLNCGPSAFAQPLPLTCVSDGLIATLEDSLDAAPVALEFARPKRTASEADALLSETVPEVSTPSTADAEENVRSVGGTDSRTASGSDTDTSKSSSSSSDSEMDVEQGAPSEAKNAKKNPWDPSSGEESSADEEEESSK
jgi:hypothetical protein